MKRLVFILSFVVTMAASCLAQGEIAMPDFTLNDTKGNSVSLASAGKGNPVMLVFWATWCNCTKELDYLNDTYSRWRKSYGLTIYSVPIDDSRSEALVKPFVEQKGWDFVTLVDEKGRLKAKLNVTNPPQFFLFNRDGVLIYQQVGSSSEFVKNVSDELERMGK